MIFAASALTRYLAGSRSAIAGIFPASFVVLFVGQHRQHSHCSHLVAYVGYPSTTLSLADSTPTCEKWVDKVQGKGPPFECWDNPSSASTSLGSIPAFQPSHVQDNCPATFCPAFFPLPGSCAATVQRPTVSKSAGHT